jgi:hypothetical protein
MKPRRIKDRNDEQREASGFTYTGYTKKKKRKTKKKKDDNPPKGPDSFFHFYIIT